jgi:TPR repeat protein
VATDAARAAALYEKACDGKLGAACQRLADDYWYGIGVATDKHKGATLMKKSCALGYQWACQRLDFMRHYDTDWRPEYDQ